MKTSFRKNQLMSRKIFAAIVRRLPLKIRRVDWQSERLYRSLGGGGFEEDAAVDGVWPRGIQSPVRGRHGYMMELDLSDWSDRRAWFFGQYYQRDLTLLLERSLRRGDQYVDIGANIGMTCLVAAKLIGGKGKGLAYEPNPEAYSRLARHMQVNRIGNFQVENFGVGELEGSMPLFVGKHLGKASLIAKDECFDAAARVDIKVVNGEHVTSRISTESPVFLKIDVEGYEMHVLKALKELWKRDDIAVVVEVTHDRLLQAGSSVNEVYEFMHKAGFVAFLFKLVRRRFSTCLELENINPANVITAQHDAVFCKRGSLFYNRYEPIIRG